MYKDSYKKGLNVAACQEERRWRLLREQKESRAFRQDSSRNLEEVVAMAKHVMDASGSDKKRSFKPRYFQDIYRTEHSLQQSEWLRELPMMLSDWLMVPCPKGKRCMVVACNRRTDMFNKNGRRIMRFRSLLPGDRKSRNAITILDCIYVKYQKTFYILDALAFGNQDFLQCDSEFRFFWIKSKCEELELSVIGNKNDMRFVRLNQYDFEDSNQVSVALQTYPMWPDNKPSLDGFLFYHKEAHYTCGPTPLVGWLYPFMVSEVLGYEVSSEYRRPANYVDFLHYMEKFDAKNVPKKPQTRPQAELMDQSEEEDEDNSLQAVLAAEKNLELEID